MSGRYLYSGADLSPDGLYRYSLTRSWQNGGGRVVFIGLNPSTADATLDDPTIRRCVGFAQALGAGELVMLNLFAWRATDPSDLPVDLRVAVGPENDKTLVEETRGALYVIAAWGSFRLAQGRATAVRALLSGVGLSCLKRTKDGSPGHPLYLPATCRPIPYGVRLDGEEQR